MSQPESVLSSTYTTRPKSSPISPVLSKVKGFRDRQMKVPGVSQSHGVDFEVRSVGIASKDRSFSGGGLNLALTVHNVISPISHRVVEARQALG